MRTFYTNILLLTFFAISCSKNAENAPTPNAPTGGQKNPAAQQNDMARYSGSDYSQSISIDAANSLIGSYLSSVKYPQQDTAIRAFAFDADTLRAYLVDTSIKTIRFHLAHTPTYIQTNSGKYAGLRPGAVTLVIAGYGQEDNLIKNSRNGVYDHCYPCPALCNQGNGLLQ